MLHCPECEGPVPILPANAILTYLAEGAANVIYQITIPPNTIIQYHSENPQSVLLEANPQKSPFDGKLLRLRKLLYSHDETAPAHREYVKLIHPLFESEHIVHQQLVFIGKEFSLIKRLNLQLKNAELNGKAPLSLSSLIRPMKRQKVYLADDCFGLLITDMRPGTDETLIEFKPKWLVQSPSAPPGSVRCRNCARRAERAQMNLTSEHQETTTAPGFCPLSLMGSCLEGSIFNVRTIAGKIIMDQGLFKKTATDDPDTIFDTQLFEHTQTLITNLTRALMDPEIGQRILFKLGKCQKSLDPYGVRKLIKLPGVLNRNGTVHANHPAVEHLRMAMTLRDCTLFIRLSNDSHGKIDARLGDLDMKSAKKLSNWLETEQRLANGQWYQGKKVQNSHVLRLLEIDPLGYVNIPGKVEDEVEMRGGGNVVSQRESFVIKRIIEEPIVSKLNDIFGPEQDPSSLAEPMVDEILAIIHDSLKSLPEGLFGVKELQDQIGSLGNAQFWEELMTVGGKTAKLLQLHSEVLDCNMNPMWNRMLRDHLINASRTVDPKIVEQAETDELLKSFFLNELNRMAKEDETTKAGDLLFPSTSQEK